ncbi:winged helix-turn-helix domain-containing protein [Streptomyces sp. NBC_01020]|uniref:AfsR/SARP family transcriptional regulator n=1 Tax=Streptomyces sp. NBC_01020 TaxID=2903722 RepID=UPI00386F3982|nr:winged helix-turn-helix domain-containing protein [Streptomyces sp. NBC_01020]
MEFRLLGAVAVATENGDLSLGPAKRAGVLTTLLLRPNAAVSVDQLTAALWEEAPPTHSRTVLHGHVSRLRALLTAHGAQAYGVELATQGSAYVLRTPESLIDAHRFDELVSLSRVQRRPADAVLMLREALSLWRGPALTGTVPSPPLEAAAHALEELRLASVEALADAYGQLGEHERAAAVLRTEAVTHPLRESLAAALMVALSRSGRQSDALDWYHRTRRLLADELGVDPGATLTGAYTAILRAKEPARVPQAAAPAAPERVPDLLPRAPRGFTGRGDERSALARAVASGDGPVCLVTGPAGVGKTALTVHWAHERRDDFPDGRLFADLRGFSDTPAPETHAVLREFLLALGVPVRGIPETAASMGALYRSLTSGLRLLVVLDNALNSQQVRPLLPGGDQCVTLVTSRDRLGGLVASDAARPVPLAQLPAADAAALLSAVLGAERIAAEPAAAARIAALCDGLPLALRVTAARLAGSPQWTLDTMAGELADEQNRLSLLAVDDTGVAASLRLTVQQLHPKAGRMFRCLGLHTGPDLDRYTAGALAGTSPAQAAAALDLLACAHLVTESPRGRYAPHDLVRLYARTTTAPEAGAEAEPGAGPEADPKAGAGAGPEAEPGAGPEAEPGAGPEAEPGAEPDGLRRLLDHYLHTALAAGAAAEPGSQPCCTLPADVLRPSAVREFADREAALDWYAAERAALRGAVEAAAAAGLHDRAWRLVLLQWPLILWRIRDGWVPLLEQALISARHEDHADAQARALALLGWVLHREGRDTEALAHLEQAPALAVRAGDVISEAIALLNLAVVLDGAQDSAADSARAGELLSYALTLATGAHHPPTEILALQHLADHCLTTGAYAVAGEHAVRALGLATSPEAAACRVQLRTTYGAALAALGRADEAAEQLGRAEREAAAAGFLDGAVLARQRLAELSAKR